MSSRLRPIPVPSRPSIRSRTVQKTEYLISDEKTLGKIYTGIYLNDKSLKDEEVIEFLNDVVTSSSYSVNTNATFQQN
jgi:hypothetical protein